MPDRQVPSRRQRFAAEYLPPSGVSETLRALLPADQPTGPAVRGLRQWLRIRILTSDALAMPSETVGTLWESLVKSDDFSLFTRGAYGRRGGRRADPSPAWSDASPAARSLTWALACEDANVAASRPHRLPDLFAADERLGRPGARRWVADCGARPCRSGAGEGCVRHGIVPHLPDRLPVQIHFGPTVRPTLDLADRRMPDEPAGPSPFARS